MDVERSVGGSPSAGGTRARRRRHMRWIRRHYYDKAPWWRREVGGAPAWAIGLVGLLVLSVVALAFVI